MSRCCDHFLLRIVIVTCLVIAGRPTQAVTVTDDFSVTHDYLFGEVTGIWAGMENVPILLGQDRFDANFANSGTLTVGDDGTFDADNDPTNGVSGMGWERGRSTAPFLFTDVPAGQDFRATVKIVSQTNVMWSTAGIIARAGNSPTPPGIGANHADENFVTMTSFRENAANTDQTTSLMKRIQGGQQVSDTLVSINGTTPANITPLPILLRLERVGGGTTYRGFVSEDGGATWQFQSRVRPDVGNPLRDPAVPVEVGLSYMTFTGFAGEAEFDDFVLETYAPKPAPGAPTIATNIGLTAHRGDVIVIDGMKDLSGLNTESMSWQLIADPMNPTRPPLTTTSVLPALLPGANGGETAVADALGAPLPVDLAEDGSTLFRWNTNVAPFDMNPPQPWALGTYKWTIRAANDWLQVSNDLTLTVTLLAELPNLPGDFNEDGSVNAADYTAWRKGVSVDTTQTNYNLWRTNFGRTLGGGASNTVPEPACLVAIAILAAGLPIRRGRRL